jgi:asparagine synthase (glutamine-hydrolysing)
MTLLAGILSRQPDRPLPDTTCSYLKQAISRRAGEEIIMFRDDRVCLLKLDIGAYGEPAFRIDPTGSVSMLAGQPIFQDENGQCKGNRQQDLEKLHQAWDRGNWSTLQNTQGVFSAVHYRPDRATVSLIGDKLGLRSLYYWIGESYLIFASALRVLEGSSDVPKVMDLRAITEIVNFGWPLGAKTPYEHIGALRAAEVIHVSDRKPTFEQYWRWDGIPVSHHPESELLRKTYRRFMTAVERRLRGDTTTVATLSGGLDSRCVVAALRGHNVRVHTFNFSLPGSQDQVFAAEFARKSRTIHHEQEISIADPKIHKAMGDAWNASTERQKWPAERPLIAWAGEGGSVGLGHVYMSIEAVALLRKRKVDAAIQTYLGEQKKSILFRLLHPQVASALENVLHVGMREELNHIHCEDPGRDLYVFLMVNDQRRHLSAYFENIDLNRFENHLPFYDGDLLVTVMGVPLDLCLRHRFYTNWLSEFQAEVTSVPWQAYPQHVPCPLPIPKGLGYQWQQDDFPAWRAAFKDELLRKSSEILGAKRFPGSILNKQYLRLVRRIYQWGIRDYSYVLQAALHYHRYWKVAGGKFVLPTGI